MFCSFHLFTPFGMNDLKTPNGVKRNKHMHWNLTFSEQFHCPKDTALVKIFLLQKQ
uniref:Uncharacterized protein n=1 Tax=Rhizophora mucronata TaxID=61149 RepID=A0A2P2NJC3_RHIMU